MTAGRPARLSRPALAMPLWGALWGAAFGSWLLAPRLLQAHHLEPGSLVAWAILSTFLLAEFAALGAFLGFFGGFALVPWLVSSRNAARDRRWLFALAAAPIVVLGYLACSALVELRQFRSTAGFEHAWAASSAAGLAGFGLVLALLHRSLAGREPRGFASLLAIVALGGLVSLPLRVGPDTKRSEAIEATALPRRAPAAAPLLFVGIDGGNWRTLEPVAAAGRVPTIAALADGGIQGDMRAAWPPFWSSPAWAAIVTGFPRDETGVYEDLAASAPGLPRFAAPLQIDPLLDPLYALESQILQTGLVRLEQHSREALRRPPFWELLDVSGIPAGVIRFRFTHPADDQATVVVSDWIGEDQWQLLLGVEGRAEPQALIAPDELAPEMTAIFSRARRRDRSALASFVADPRRPPPAEVLYDPLDLLAIALDVDERTVAAAELAMRRRPDLRALAVYLGGFDTVGHAFFQYRFPGDFSADPPDAPDVAALGAVIDRYWEQLDEWIERLVRSFPERPTVMLVADHGHEAIRDHVLWKGWHSMRGGIFIAGGPGVRRRPERLSVSYGDVLPTVLDLQGLVEPAGLPGRSLLRAAEREPVIVDRHSGSDGASVGLPGPGF